MLRESVDVGQSVAVIGSGGVGFDVCEFLVSDGNFDIDRLMSEWGLIGV